MNGSKKKKLIDTLALFSLTIGAVGWFIAQFDILNYDSIELPNSQPRGIYLDDIGNIFCGSGAYERIQMYNMNGDFVRGFSTDVGKGRGSLFTYKVQDKKLYIYVYGVRLGTERLDRKIIYSLDGTLLQTSDVLSVEYTGYNVINDIHDSFGNSYVFKGLLFPRVVKKTNQSRAILINTPICLWPLQAPFPSFILFYAPLLYLAGFKYLLRKRQIKPKDN